MSHEKWGYLEVGPKLNDSHNKFANELVLEILLAEIPQPERQRTIEKRFRTIRELLPVIEIVDIIFTIYARSRRLHQ
jgi:hypothetical protein